METNHQGNQRVLLVINAAVEAENNIRTIKAAVQSVGGGPHQSTCVSMHRGGSSMKTAGSIGNFQYEKNNSMLAETMEDYALVYAKTAY